MNNYWYISDEELTRQAKTKRRQRTQQTDRSVQQKAVYQNKRAEPAFEIAGNQKC